MHFANEEVPGGGGCDFADFDKSARQTRAGRAHSARLPFSLHAKRLRNPPAPARRNMGHIRCQTLLRPTIKRGLVGGGRSPEKKDMRLGGANCSAPPSGIGGARCDAGEAFIGGNVADGGGKAVQGQSWGPFLGATHGKGAWAVPECVAGAHQETVAGGFAGARGQSATRVGDRKADRRNRSGRNRTNGAVRKHHPT